MTDKVQLRVVKAIQCSVWTEPNRIAGDVVWVSRDGAEQLVKLGLCEYFGNAFESAESGPLRKSLGWPLDRFSWVSKDWDGETVACIASGPSTTEEDLHRVKSHGIKAIVVNDMYLVAPWADVVYFADCRWWEWHHNGVAKKWDWMEFTAEEQRAAFGAFAGQKCTIANTGMLVGDPEVFMLKNGGHLGLSESKDALFTGSNSGYQAINLACLAGAKKILLLGYDLGFHKNRSHSHNGHPIKNTSAAHYSGWASNFFSLVEPLERLGIEVINCSRQTTLKAFRREALESILPD